MLRLEWIRPDGTIAHRWLAGEASPVTIGRHPESDVPLHGYPTASGVHAHLTFELGAWFVTDRGSLNGTEHLRDSGPLPPGIQLRPGDTIRIPGDANRRAVALRVVDKPPPASVVSGLEALRETIPVDGDPGSCDRATPQAPVSSLTERQLELLRLFAEDPRATNRSAAEQLSISPDTVKSSLKMIYVALRVTGTVADKRARALEIARDLGLL